MLLKSQQHIYLKKRAQPFYIFSALCSKNWTLCEITIYL